jgi:septum formation protein
VLPGEAPLDYVARVTRAKLDSAQQTMILRQLPHRPLLRPTPPWWSTT